MSACDPLEGVETLGNAALFNQVHAAFLCSRRVTPQAILKSLDWATQMRRENRVIMGAFQSPLERKVLDFLLRGTQGIILVLARPLWKAPPLHLREPLNQNRLLILSPFPNSPTRVNSSMALHRNDWILSHAPRLILGSLDPSGSLSHLLASHPSLPYTLFD